MWWVGRREFRAELARLDQLRLADEASADELARAFTALEARLDRYSLRIGLVLGGLVVADAIISSVLSYLLTR